MPGKHMSTEQNLFLKLGIENSELLGKEECMQLKCLRNNDIMHLQLLTAVETFKAKLIATQKEYDIKFL